jgi:hypothetical protein
MHKSIHMLACFFSLRVCVDGVESRDLPYLRWSRRCAGLNGIQRRVRKPVSRSRVGLKKRGAGPMAGPDANAGLGLNASLHAVTHLIHVQYHLP